MADKKCVLKKDLYYVWIECEYTNDGTAFCGNMRKYEDSHGWKNILTLIPFDKKGKSRIDTNHDQIEIKKFKFREGIKGKKDIFLIWVKADEPTNFFLESWIFNPGVYGNPVNKSHFVRKQNVSARANIVCVSGHGGLGKVWSSFKDNEISLLNGIDEAKRDNTWNPPQYLIIPACFNVSYAMAPKWLPVFENSPPIRGILGYSDGYPGSKAGAGYLENFINNVIGEKMTILESWKDAHKGMNKPSWGAIMHPDAIDDKFTDCNVWQTALQTKKTALYFDSYEWSSGGIKVTGDRPDFEISIFGKKSDISDSDSQLPIDYLPGRIIAGKRGYLYLTAKKGHSFHAGDKIKVVFYYFRPSKTGMKLKALMKFDEQDKVIKNEENNSVKEDENKILKLMHLNDKTSGDTMDGFEYTVLSDGTEIKIWFDLEKNAHKKYEKSGGDGGATYGYFWVALKINDDVDWIPCYFTGAWLKPPKYSPADD